MNAIKILLIVLIAGTLSASAQKVSNTSYVTEKGEKVLRLEIVIPVGQKEAWTYFTNNDKLKLWIAPVAQINLRTGGEIITNYDKTRLLSDITSIHLPIINYLPMELLTFKVNLNSNFDKDVVASDKNLQEIIQFLPAGKGKTKIVSSMVGWGTGQKWDNAYGFFLKGNTWTYEQLGKVFKKGE